MTQSTDSNVRMLSAIGYIPFLFFIPLFANREDEYAQFHAKQSLVLFCVLILAWIAIWLVDLIFGGILGRIFILGFLFKGMAWLIHNILGTILSLGYLVLVILGIINASSGNFWRIPIIGAYAERLKI
uniref:DUF4870 domain-containing protein n=1 Tax=candidate division WOR-3 bacterium TaxID=2052148 RepID=A0A7C6EE67_UNCW3